MVRFLLNFAAAKLGSPSPLLLTLSLAWSCPPSGPPASPSRPRPAPAQQGGRAAGTRVRACVCACKRVHACVGVRAGGSAGPVELGGHAAFLAAHCSVPVAMATGAAAPFWALAWLCGAARPPVCPPVLLPSRGSCQLLALPLPTGPARPGASKRVY